MNRVYKRWTHLIALWYDVYLHFQLLILLSANTLMDKAAALTRILLGQKDNMSYVNTPSCKSWPKSIKTYDTVADKWQLINTQSPSAEFTHIFHDSEDAHVIHSTAPEQASKWTFSWACFNMDEKTQRCSESLKVWDIISSKANSICRTWLRVQTCLGRSHKSIFNSLDIYSSVACSEIYSDVDLWALKT